MFGMFWTGGMPGSLTRPLLELTAGAMRGPSYWTAGDREYLAMCTAQLHQCPFCIDSHTGRTRIAGHGEIDPEDPASARPQLRAVREFLDLTSRTPDRVNATEATAGARVAGSAAQIFEVQSRLRSVRRYAASMSAGTHWSRRPRDRALRIAGFL
jgi:AhpD family alkylhydroperoxidase